MADARRIARVESRIRRDVAEMLQRDIKDPRFRGLVTVLRVKVARDLGHARVFYSVLGTEKDKKLVQQAVTSLQGFVQKTVGRELGIRVLPKVEFTLDESVEIQARMSKLIDKAVKSDSKGAGRKRATRTTGDSKASRDEEE